MKFNKIPIPQFKKIYNLLLKFSLRAQILVLKIISHYSLPGDKEDSQEGSDGTDDTGPRMSSGDKDETK